MSERKGGAHITNRVSINISGEYDKLLINQAKRHKLSKRKIVEKLIAANEAHGIVEEDWERKIHE